MEHGLNKILDIINDMAHDISLNNERDFLRGYLVALRESGEINFNEQTLLIRFYDHLIDYIKMMKQEVTKC